MTFFDEIFWAGNVSPAHIVDMQQAIETAEIDKSAEAGKALYGAFYDITDIGIFKKGFAVLFERIFKIFSSINYNVISIPLAIKDHLFNIESSFFA